MKNLKATVIGGVLLAGLAIFLVSQHRAQVGLREENEELRQQIVQLVSNQESLSNSLAQSVKTSSLSSEHLRELLKLRGEVGLLRRQKLELERATATANSTPPGEAKETALGTTSPPNTPAPFQIQMILDGPGEDSEAMTNNASQSGAETIYVQKTPLLDHTAISSANVTTDPSTGVPQIDVEFSELGKELFAAITKENINKRLAIVLGGQLYAAPMIRSEISGGKAQVTGSFSEPEARELAAKINDALTGK